MAAPRLDQSKLLVRALSLFSLRAQSPAHPASFFLRARTFSASLLWFRLPVEHRASEYQNQSVVASARPCVVQTRESTKKTSDRRLYSQRTNNFIDNQREKLTDHEVFSLK